MASRSATTSVALFVALNLLFCTLVSSTSSCPPPSSAPVPKGHKHHGHHKHPMKCPKDTLKLGVCANVLNDLVHLVVGTPATTPCCSLLGNMVDLEAAVCLCTALKANVLGMHLNVHIALTLLLNVCGKSAPEGFVCA
ncbi:14 kDa proline-rich protein DC2.15 [Linum grandiflorum]